MKTKQITVAGLTAAIYVVLTLTLAPISYGPVQFRLAEILKSLALFDPCFIPAFVVGNLAANLFSPYIGGWELVWMPCANLVGALLCWKLRKWPLMGTMVYAIIISAAVSIMLHFISGLPILFLLLSIGASELILIVGGYPIMKRAWIAAVSAPKRG